MYYTRSLYFDIIIDISKLKADDREAVAEYLELEHKAYRLTYPSDFAIEVAKRMATHGHTNLNKTPAIIKPEQMAELFVRSVLKFNVHGQVRNSPRVQGINKQINSDKDYVRIVDDLSTQQDGISLSQIYQMAKRPKVAFCDRKNPLNNRLGRARLDLGHEFIGKKKLIPTLAAVKEAIEKASKDSQKIEEQNHREGKYLSI